MSKEWTCSLSDQAKLGSSLFQDLSAVDFYLEQDNLIKQIIFGIEIQRYHFFMPLKIGKQPFIRFILSLFH
jgi:hypothetical protein